MMSINELTAFLGWCTIVNMGVLIFSTLFITLLKSFAIDVHSKLLGIDAAELPKMYFSYLANYKIMVLMFNFAPYIALKILA